MSELVVRGGTIVTVDDDHHVVAGDVAIVDGVIVQVGGAYTPRSRDYTIVDAAGCLVMPGQVLAHVRTCHALARGRGDDLAPPAVWRRQVAWPYEAALDAAAVGAAARLALAELLLGGTTTILDLATVRHTDEVFAAAEQAGVRATIGKALMDTAAPDVPAGLCEPTRAALDDAEQLATRWHGAAGDRLRFAYAPRHLPGCSDELLAEVGRRARAGGRVVQVETGDDAAALRARFGARVVPALHALGLTGPHVSLVHGVALADDELALLAATGTHVVCCPSAELGAGASPLPTLLARGVAVALGAASAPGNHSLDGFLELRLAALVAEPGGARALPAPQAVRVMTRGGAAALGQEARLGALAVGRRGDVIAVELGGAHVVPCERPFAALTRACRAGDVRHVAVDGALVVRDRQLVTLDLARVVADARHHAHRVLARL